MSRVGCIPKVAFEAIKNLGKHISFKIMKTKKCLAIIVIIIHCGCVNFINNMSDFREDLQGERKNKIEKIVDLDLDLLEIDSVKINIKKKYKYSPKVPFIYRTEYSNYNQKLKPNKNEVLMCMVLSCTSTADDVMKFERFYVNLYTKSNDLYKIKYVVSQPLPFGYGRYPYIPSGQSTLTLMFSIPPDTELEYLDFVGKKIILK